MENKISSRENCEGPDLEGLLRRQKSEKAEVHRALKVLLPEEPRGVGLGGGTTLCLRCASGRSALSGSPELVPPQALLESLLKIVSMGAKPLAWLSHLSQGQLGDLRVQRCLEKSVGAASLFSSGVGYPTPAIQATFESGLRREVYFDCFMVGLMDTGSGKGDPAEGDLLLLIGGGTYPEAPGGADSRFVVDPLTSRQLVEAIQKVRTTTDSARFAGIAGGGLLGAVYDLLSQSGLGASLDIGGLGEFGPKVSTEALLLAPQRERALLSVPPETVERVENAVTECGISCQRIGKVTESGPYNFHLQEREVGSISPENVKTRVDDLHLADGSPDYTIRTKSINLAELEEPEELTPILKDLVSSPLVCSREWITSQFDWTVGGGTLVGPRESAACLAPEGRETALAMCLADSGLYGSLDPQRGGMIAIAQAARRLVCAGATPVAAALNLHFGAPRGAAIPWQIQMLTKGISEAAEAFGVVIEDCRVTLHEDADVSFPPAVTLAMVGTLSQSEPMAGAGFRKEGDVVVLFGHIGDEVTGCGYFQRYYGFQGGPCPSVNLGAERDTLALCVETSRQGWLRSACPVAVGGLAVALAECAIRSPGGLGASVRCRGRVRRDILLFGESQARVIATVPQEFLGPIERLAYQQRVACHVLGEVRGKRLYINQEIDVEVAELKRLHSQGLEREFE